MKVTKRGRKRNRIIVALMFPALVLVWLVGWSLYWFGRRKEDKPRTPRKRNEAVELIAARTLEEEPVEA